MTPTATASARPDASDLAAQVRDWLAQHLTEKLRTDRVPPVAPTLAELIRFETDLHAAGFAGVTWPRAYAGQGLTLREHLTINRELGRAPIPRSINSIGKELAGPIIMAVGTDTQKARYLPAILKMTEIWCQGFSEPGAGSDLAGLRTRAERTGDGWCINGQKIWTSGASKSQRCLLLARTGAPQDRHKGLVMFGLRLDSPGVEVREVVSIDGHRSFCEVFFNDVLVDDADRLGLPDEGWSAAVRVLAIERATNRMYRAWRFQNELDHLVAACRTDARAFALLKSHARDLAQIRVEIELLKGHVETLVECLLAGEEIGPRGSFPKLYWSESHQRFCRIAWDIVSALPPGVDGPLRDLRARMEDLYLGSRAETIYAGTTEIQLDIISKRILSLKKVA